VAAGIDAVSEMLQVAGYRFQGCDRVLVPHY